MTLDPSTVICKVGGSTSPVQLTLSPAAPEISVDGPASVAVITGTALTAVIDNAFQPVGSWSQVSSPQSVAAGVRRAFKQGGPNHVPLSIAFS